MNSTSVANITGFMILSKPISFNKLNVKILEIFQAFCWSVDGMCVLLNAKLCRTTLIYNVHIIIIYMENIVEEEVELYYSTKYTEEKRIKSWTLKSDIAEKERKGAESGVPVWDCMKAQPSSVKMSCGNIISKRDGQHKQKYYYNEFIITQLYNMIWFILEVHYTGSQRHCNAMN